MKIKLQSCHGKAADKRIRTIRILPLLQHVHREISFPLTILNISTVFKPSNLSLYVGLPVRRLHNISFVFLLRFARRPKYLIFTKPLGRICIKNLLTNSTPFMVTVFCLFPFLRSFTWMVTVSSSM